MKKMFLGFLCGMALLSCNNDKTASETATTTPAADSSIRSAPVEVPYTASYSSDFTDGVSDADLKMVMVSYKDWADGNMTNVTNAYNDTLSWERPGGEHLKLPKGDIMKMWATYRDSLSSVVIEMQAWRKMYANDKKESWVATWYKEIDTYKSGKIDSAYYHDLSFVINGKIGHLEQYKRPAK